MRPDRVQCGQSQRQLHGCLTWQEFTGFLTIIDLQTNKIVQEVGPYPGPYLGDENVAADGPFIPQTARRFGCRRSMTSYASA